MSSFTYQNFIIKWAIFEIKFGFKNHLDKFSTAVCVHDYIVGINNASKRAYKFTIYFFYNFKRIVDIINLNFERNYL